MLYILLYWMQVSQHSLYQSPTLETIKTLLFQYSSWQIKVWYLSPSQQKQIAKISYENYSYITEPLCKTLKANFKGWFVFWQQIRFSCALITEKLEFKSTGDGKSDYKRRRGNIKTKGKQEQHLYIKIYLGEVTNSLRSIYKHWCYAYYWNYQER